MAWQCVDPALNPSLRALTSAASLVGASGTFSTKLLLADTMPLVFSFPVLPSSLNADGSDFEVTLSDGTTVTPQIAGLLPNLEHNERQTVVIEGDFGNRTTPGCPGARYPTSVTIVNDGTPLQMIGRSGPVNAVGLSIDSSNSYMGGNGLDWCPRSSIGTAIWERADPSVSVLHHNTTVARIPTAIRLSIG